VRPEPVQPFDDIRHHVVHRRVVHQSGDEMSDNRRELLLTDAMREMRRAQPGGGDRLRARSPQEIVQQQGVLASQNRHVNAGKRRRKDGIRQQVVVELVDGGGYSGFAAEAVEQVGLGRWPGGSSRHRNPHLLAR
jgi:hypothetical protein